MFVIPCQCRNISGARAEITVNDDPVPVTMEETGQYSFLVKFTPTVAAAHKISFHANGRCIKTFYKHFLPGTKHLFAIYYSISTFLLAYIEKFQKNNKITMPKKIRMLNCYPSSHVVANAGLFPGYIKKIESAEICFLRRKMKIF